MLGAMNNKYMNIFNSEIEIGIRVLVLLEKSRLTKHSLQRLCVYDYLLLHAGDIDKMQINIHPLHPYRGSEYPIKFQSIEKAIYLIISRKLINVYFDADGINYGRNERTTWFLNAFESEYVDRIKRTAEWINDNFAGSTDEELAALIKQGIGNWGDEYTQEILISREGF